MLAMLALLVAGAFALVVFGLGRVPSHRQVALLVAAAAAAVVSAALWVPIRARCEPVARRLVRRERGAPEEALRVFGTRLSLALPLDELLLQLAETLRRTLRLEMAEVWIASDSLPGTSRLRLRRGARTSSWTDGEHRVAGGGAGVCGAARGPSCVVAGCSSRGVPHAELRVAPIVNADELLGLIVRAASSGGAAVRRGGRARPGASSPGRPDPRFAICVWIPRCRPPSTSCGCRPRSFALARRVVAAPTTSADGSSATSTRAPNSS